MQTTGAQRLAKQLMVQKIVEKSVIAERWTEQNLCLLPPNLKEKCTLK